MIGGNPIQENEFKDLADMMHNLGLYEALTKGCYYTWSNKSNQNTIYSRIDRMIGNVQWFQTYHNSIVEVMAPRNFDHAPMRFRAHTQVLYRRTIFKFLNFITQDPSYLQIVARIWKENVRGSAMYRVWRKLHRLQPSIKPLIKSVTDI